MLDENLNKVKLHPTLANAVLSYELLKGIETGEQNRGGWGDTGTPNNFDGEALTPQ